MSVIFSSVIEREISVAANIQNPFGKWIGWAQINEQEWKHKANKNETNTSENKIKILDEPKNGTLKCMNGWASQIN